MNNHTLTAHYGIKATETNLSFINSLITSSGTVGTLISLMFVFPILETKGKKFLVVYARSFFTVTSAICQLWSAFFQATEFYILGQFIDGVHHPLATFITFMFVTECAPDKNRGFACTSLFISMDLIKIAMLSVASPGVFGKEDTWYVFPSAALINSIIAFGLTVRLPESPKWLVCQNKIKEANQAIKFYHGRNCETNDVINSYVKEKNLTKESHISLRQIWNNDTLREGLLVLFSVMLFVLLDSANVQGIYSIQLHETAGFTVQEALNINLILTILFFPTQFIGTYIIDHLGRRPVMFIGGILMYVKSWLILITEFVIVISGDSLLTKLMYISMEFISSSVGATGITSLRILFVTELFPPSAKTAVSQALLFTSLAINAPVVSSFPILYNVFPPGFFIPFVFTQLILGVYLYRHMPETKGRAVCDIIETMDNEISSRAPTICEEKLPLIKQRAETLMINRNNILNTPRSRASTFHPVIATKKFLPH